MTTFEDVENLTLGGEVQTLAGVPDGRWLVETQGSFHVWDLDAFTYARVPGRESRAGSMAYDGDAFKIWSVSAWPTVGACALVDYTDPTNFTQTQFRRSSTVRSIRRIEGTS